MAYFQDHSQMKKRLISKG